MINKISPKKSPKRSLQTLKNVHMKLALYIPHSHLHQIIYHFQHLSSCPIRCIFGNVIFFFRVSIDNGCKLNCRNFTSKSITFLGSTFDADVFNCYFINGYSQFICNWCLKHKFQLLKGPVYFLVITTLWKRYR